MSTRCTVTVRDTADDPEGYSFYRHADGYPDTVLPELAFAFDYTKAPDCFDAPDFAAGLVTAWKIEHRKLMISLDAPCPGGGSIYLTEGRDAHDDTQYHYEIYGAGGQIWAQSFHRVWRGDKSHWRKLGKIYRIALDRCLTEADHEPVI